MGQFMRTPFLLSIFFFLLVPVATFAQTMPSTSKPPAETDAKKAMDASPRHGEFVDVKLPDGKPLHCWIVYPEVKDKAPVVIVIQEIFGLSDWLRATTDQLAADGFIAIAPDFLSGAGPNGGGTDSFASRDDVVKAVRNLKPDDVTQMLDATADFAKAIPSANGKLASVGFCWGGGTSFSFATHRADLSAAVVCYGTPPTADAMKNIHCPVFGFYGKDDARVTATVPKAEAEMKEAGKSYQSKIFDGAGHGFFRQQDGRDGANLKAAEEGWPMILEFLREQTK
jgi:carboxymethylenebutenolidase